MTSLRLRILLLLSLAALALLGTAWWVQQRHLLPSFLALERQHAMADLQRGQEALSTEVRFVSDYVSDWAGWDDSYRFVADHNPEFVATELNTKVFSANSFDFLAMIGLDRVEVWRGAMLRGRAVEVDELPRGTWPVQHSLLAPRGLEDLASGIVVTAHGPLLLASRPITDSAHAAEPRGWIVMGRFLTAERVEALRRQTRLDLSITAAATGGTGDDAATIEPRLRATGDTLIVDAIRPGLRGQADALHVAVRLPRAIVAEGQAALGYALAITGVAVLLLFALLTWVLQRGVVGPVTRLTEHALHIRASGDLRCRSGLHRRDEIGTLAAEFDAMVAQLATLQELATRAARDGGMAEVARSVLHDVGNALQPVQSHLGALRACAASGHAEDLQRVCALLRTHVADLGAWLEQDPRGRQVPAFLQTLAAEMQNGQRGLTEQVEHLGQGLEHIRHLVERQVDTAAARGLSETVDLQDLVAEAVRMTAGAGGEPVVTAAVAALSLHCEKHRLLAVLINLLRNAHHAVRGLPASMRRIEVSAQALPESRCRITVVDNGCGIAAADLTRIFAGGYSTRPGSRGLGLHGCANSITEMRGRLWAESAGAGRGATFVLELPIGAPVAALGVA